jgi:hypothetical protein
MYKDFIIVYKSTRYVKQIYIYWISNNYESMNFNTPVGLQFTTMYHFDFTFEKTKY